LDELPGVVIQGVSRHLGKQSGGEADSPQRRAEVVNGSIQKKLPLLVGIRI
jgi:hypothetical protein